MQPLLLQRGKDAAAAAAAVVAAAAAAAAVLTLPAVGVVVRGRTVPDWWGG
jgi:hypothetical protein